jgi:hypothetical protein
MRNGAPPLGTPLANTHASVPMTGDIVTLLDRVRSNAASVTASLEYEDVDGATTYAHEIEDLLEGLADELFGASRQCDFCAADLSSAEQSDAIHARRQGYPTACAECLHAQSVRPEPRAVIAGASTE